MKVRIINKAGKSWNFDSVKAARPHIKKDYFNHYEIVIENGKKIRVYDDRDYDTRNREKPDFSISPLGGPRMPVRTKIVKSDGKANRKQWAKGIDRMIAYRKKHGLSNDFIC